MSLVLCFGTLLGQLLFTLCIVLDPTEAKGGSNPGGPWYIDEESLIDTLFSEANNNNNENNGDKKLDAYGLPRSFGYRPSDPRFWMGEEREVGNWADEPAPKPRQWESAQINWNDLPRADLNDLNNNNNEEVIGGIGILSDEPQGQDSHKGGYIMKKQAEVQGAMDNNNGPAIMAMASKRVQGGGPGSVPAGSYHYYGSGVPGGGDSAAASGLSPYYIGLITGSTIVGVVVIIGAGICYYKISNRFHSTADVDYPAYGVTGPAPPSTKSPTSESGIGIDSKLASSAHMYHYQHQKQQMQQAKHTIEKEGLLGEKGSGGPMSEDEEDDGDEDGDYTVYECPGFAAGGDMEVKNPLFAGTSDDLSVPMSPACTMGEEGTTGQKKPEPGQKEHQDDDQGENKENAKRQTKTTTSKSGN